MDLILLLAISLYMSLKTEEKRNNNESSDIEIGTNESYYRDENAFMLLHKLTLNKGHRK